MTNERKLKESAKKYSKSLKITGFKSTSFIRDCSEKDFIQGAISEAAREYWQQQQAPDMEEVRNKWEQYCKSNDIFSPFKESILNFFAPFIKGSDWISVGSAPKDGTPIIGYDPNTDKIYIVFWNRSMGDGCWNYDGTHYIPKISLWKPLPNNPNIKNTQHHERNKQYDSIEFAEWILKNNFIICNDIDQPWFEGHNKTYNATELYELFKQTKKG